MSAADPARELLQRADHEIEKSEVVQRRAKRLLTVLAAANECGVSASTMLNWIKSGAVAAVAIPQSRGTRQRQHYRVPIAEVEKIVGCRS